MELGFVIADLNNVDNCTLGLELFRCSERNADGIGKVDVMLVEGSLERMFFGCQVPCAVFLFL